MAYIKSFDYLFNINYKIALDIECNLFIPIQTDYLRRFNQTKKALRIFIPQGFFINSADNNPNRTNYRLKFGSEMLWFFRF